MATKVWVDDWQMQCCGEPFAVGDEVSWTLRDPDTEWLELVLGNDLAGGVDKAEEHHGGVDEDVTSTVGIGCCDPHRALPVCPSFRRRGD